MNGCPPQLPANLWRQDDSLRRAGELLDLCRGQLRAVSFDFFDTLVWRLNARPADVFVEVGHRLQQQGLLPAHLTPRDYEVLRRMAEGKVREHQILTDKSREDIALDEICTQLRAISPDAMALARTELEAEADCCLLNPATLEFARHARNLGLQVLIVSDIYLSADHLGAILRANGLDPALFDAIYTSSDAGVCKGTGNLFRHVLKRRGLDPAQLLHLGDNYHADVGGARKAGVRACHYVQAKPDGFTILDRERVLLGGNSPAFSINALRLLAARHFSDDTDEAFFGRSGAWLLGPHLARYATWACEQFVAAGVRKVGAFMREGELLGQLLQQEADAAGHPLEITPLYVNRKSTDLAAIGRLTADNLIDWLERRQTLPVKTILEHFGLRPSELHQLPFDPDEIIRTPDRIVKFARYLFTPAIAERIEARSAEERRKVLDYLRPWLDSGAALGVCDIGYNASAQLQLKKILDLERNSTPIIGCYLVTCERAAQRILDGLDVRHFLGAFGRPDFHHFAFLRSPAFVEQAITAPIGTTLGYERLPDGSVQPVLDTMRFSPELIRRQRAFKEGVLHYQRLWLWFRANKTSVLDHTSELSRRVLAAIDAGCAPILARATAFPVQAELARFGSIPLDDHYFVEGYKTICGPKERDLLRTKGFARLLTEQGVLWPQAVQQLEAPRAAADFFSYAKRMLLCTPEGDHDGSIPDVTVILQPTRPDALRACLRHLKVVSSRDLRLEILVLTAKDAKDFAAAANEFARDLPRLRLSERSQDQTVVQHLNNSADGSQAPLLLFLDDGVHLQSGWDTALLDRVRQSPSLGALVSPHREPAMSTRCMVIRHRAFSEGLGFSSQLHPVGASLNLLLNLRSLDWGIASWSADAARDVSPPPQPLTTADQAWLERHWPGFAETLTRSLQSESPSDSTHTARVDWIGSFLDHGSLSHVNREITRALESCPGLALQRIQRGLEHGQSCPPNPSDSRPTEKMVRAALTSRSELGDALAAEPSADAVVTVRHAWPPDWQRPAQGALVVIQPWEYGILPEMWVRDLRRVDECWVPSECVRRMYLDSGVPADKVFVIPNGIDPERFQPDAPPLALATRKRFKFLFVGGTIHRKGPDVLLKAYLQAFTSADDVCLVIKDFGGKDVYQGQTFGQQIRAAQADPAAPEILHLDTDLPPEDLPGLYTACDCLVHPYRGEGFGLPVLEAMACGLAVIVTQGGATDDFAKPHLVCPIPSTRRTIGTKAGPFTLAHSGWLLEPDLEAVVRGMRELFSNPEQARDLGRKASEHARRDWSWQRAAGMAAARVRELARRQAKDQAEIAARRERKPVAITLPACGRLGSLDRARTLLQQKNLADAWAATLGALQERPFHPEAVLLLGETAGAAGDSVRPRQLFERAARMAPQWKPARQALKNHRACRGPARLDLPPLPDFLRSSSTPRLTVCLITRNEEQFLDRCLRSVHGLAHQIVVVDTGSTDRTREIARSHGAEVHEFPWIDDFSAARNVALEHARGDWILVLDADEELPADQHDILRQHLRDTSALAYRLPIVDIGHEAEGCHHVPRLFRNAPGLFYVGRIHEQVFSSVEVRREQWGLDNRIGTAQLLHHGYTKEVVRERNKTARNLRLLEMAVADIPNDANLLLNLGLELVRSGRLNTGLDRYFEAFECLSSQPPGRIVPELRENLLTQLATHLLTARRHEDILRVLTSPLARTGELTATHHFLLGLAHMELRRYPEAMAALRECLVRRDRPALTPAHKDVRKAGPNHCLALCAVAMKQNDVADQAFRDAIQDEPHARLARFDYARFLASRQHPVPALEWLHQLVTEQPSDAPAWELGARLVLSRAEFLEVARDWTAEALRNVPESNALALARAEALFLSGDCADSLPLWRAHAAPQSAVHFAATFLCEAASGLAPKSPAAPMIGPVTQEVLTWCRRLADCGSGEPLEAILHNIASWEPALPAAARAFRAAFAEVKATVGQLEEVAG